MKKYKLHQWLPLLLFFAVILFTACNKKGYPVNSTDAQDKYENTKASTNGYTPPAVISISDDLAKANKDGEMYYDNEYGYRYWRLSDGKYYLDTKYNSGAKPAKKSIKKQHKRSPENDYAHE